MQRCTVSEDFDTITELAPFLSEKTLDWLVDKMTAAGTVGELVGLYPFLSRESLCKLVRNMTREDGD